MPVKIYIIGAGKKDEDEEDIGEDDRGYDDNTKIQNVNKHIGAGHHTYIFVFMDGCGPCNSTKPNWRNFAKQYKSTNANNSDKNIMIVRINKDLFGKLKGAGEEPGGFPTLRHVSNKTSSEYEKQMGNGADRSVDSFNNWVTTTIAGQNGGRIRKSRKRKTRKTRSKKSKSKRSKR